MAGWRTRALGALRDLAASGQPFTADDVLERAGHPDDGHSPNGRNNAVGSLFRQAAAEGSIVQTGGHQKSRQPHRKGGLILEWVGVKKAALF